MNYALQYRPVRFSRSLLALSVSVVLIVATGEILAVEPTATTKPPALVNSPLSPAEAQRLFQLPADLQIELAAAEPEVIDPVAIRFDELGRMWVAEMRDYPLGPAAGGEPQSTIRILEDTDGDGRFEKSTLFADKLLFVTGLQPWQGGVIATVSGKVLYLKDTSGDNRCDVQEVWFDGFSETNSQLRANHPTLALDNWVYIAGGLRGGFVVDHRPKAENTEPINISGMDFRFDPLSGKAEAISGNGQFGLAFDDWGNRFVCSNRNPAQHVVLENYLLKRAPQVAVPAVMHDVAKAGEQSRIFPLSRAWTTSNLHAGQFTAACGVQIYRGDLLPEAYRGNIFTCDPTGNLVHREIMQPQGITFTSQPATEGTEFLASPDEWFRPVSLQLGPDGAWYVVDMYRAVIEHPEWVPEEQKNRPDQRLGDDRGRIWRIAPKGSKPQTNRTLDKNLTANLNHPSGWQRDTAQRLLLQQLPLGEKSAAGMIEQLKKACRESASLPGRIQAASLFWKLGGNEATIRSALDGSSLPLQLWETERIAKLGRPADMLWLAKMGASEHSALRTAALVGLAGNADQLPPDQVAAIVSRVSADPWEQTALLLAASQEPEAWLAALLASKQVGENDVASNELVRKLAVQLASTKSPGTGLAALQAIAHPAAITPAQQQRQQCALLGLGLGLQRRGASLATLPGLGAELGAFLSQQLLAATAVAKAEDSAPEARLRSVEFLGVLPQSSPILAELAASTAPVAVRKQAIVALGRLPELEPWQDLLARFPTESPSLRQAILEGVLSSVPRTQLLIAELQAGKIKPTEIDPAQTNRLTGSTDAGIREAAAKILGSSTPEDRKKALADYQVVLALTGDARKGQAIFTKNCITCHKIGDLGVNVAPDISDSRTKTAAQLLGDIIQPNRAIDANYVAYLLVTTDGTTASGILAAETSTSISLKAPGNKIITIPRSEIDQLRSTGLSLMPEGLEKTIPHQEMADLLAFIKNWRYLDGQIPGLGK